MELRRSAGRAVASRRAPDPKTAPRALFVGHWAHATVFAERHVSGSTADTASDSWIVRELDARAVPAAHGPRCLVFENHRVVRRLWDYPQGWLSLSDAALLAVAGVTP